MKIVKDPKLPSDEGIKKHELVGQIPFRDWCPICIKAKGREMDHTRDQGRDRRFLEYSSNYCFPDDEFGYGWIVLVGNERGSGAFMATTVATQRASGTSAPDNSYEFIDLNGDRETDIIFKAEQEPSVEFL